MQGGFVARCYRRMGVSHEPFVRPLMRRIDLGRNPEAGGEPPSSASKNLNSAQNAGWLVRI